jgi:hypothetical protein
VGWPSQRAYSRMCNKYKNLGGYLEENGPRGTAILKQISETRRRHDYITTRRKYKFAVNSVTSLRAGNLLSCQATRLVQEHTLRALCRRTSKNLQEKTKARLGAGKRRGMQTARKGREEVLFCIRAVKTPSADKCMAGGAQGQAFRCAHTVSQSVSQSVP